MHFQSFDSRSLVALVVLFRLLKLSLIFIDMKKNQLQKCKYHKVRIKETITNQ
jgi:hypothetical protein